MATSFFLETGVPVADTGTMISEAIYMKLRSFIINRSKDSATVAVVKLVVIPCPLSLPKPKLATPYHAILEPENQNSEGSQSDTFATAESVPLSVIDISVFDSAGIIAQLDKQSEGKILPIMTKAPLDLKFLDGFEELLAMLFISRERERNFKLIFIGVGGTLLGGIIMFLVLAFL
ncbi:hypothetical protein EV368DRAFT_64028 [Lentinula lateritia]|nr:hypothetical protein EV368DRAFT_64028 [Lentinula lateritia]